MKATPPPLPFVTSFFLFPHNLLFWVSAYGVLKLSLSNSWWVHAGWRARVCVLIRSLRPSEWIPHGSLLLATTSVFDLCVFFSKPAKTHCLRGILCMPTSVQTSSDSMHTELISIVQSMTEKIFSCFETLKAEGNLCFFFSHFEPFCRCDFFFAIAWSSAYIIGRTF